MCQVENIVWPLITHDNGQHNAAQNMQKGVCRKESAKCSRRECTDGHMRLHFWCELRREAGCIWRMAYMLRTAFRRRVCWARGDTTRLCLCACPICWRACDALCLIANATTTTADGRANLSLSVVSCSRSLCENQLQVLADQTYVHTSKTCVCCCWLLMFAGGCCQAAKSEKTESFQLNLNGHLVFNPCPSVRSILFLRSMGRSLLASGPALERPKFPH